MHSITSCTRYIEEAIAGTIDVPKYVKKQCERLKAIFDGTDPKYTINLKTVKVIEAITGFMIMPKGLSAGKTVKETLTDFQWLFIIATLTIVYRENEQKRKIQTVVLEIARKNAKTFIIAVLFILLFFIEPKFSKFYSVAPNGKLSREVQDAIREIIKSSPVLNEGATKRFKTMRDKIICLLNDSEYTPLNYSNDKLDGKLPSVFLVDEAGCLPNSYAMEAMRSGQLTILNKLGFVISTKYPKVNNPFEDEVAYSKRVLEDLEEDETWFSLLYEPDDTVNWATNDSVLRHSNPLALDVQEIWEDLLKKRQRAIAMPSSQENFLCKHCNIAFSAGTEGFVDIGDLRRGKETHIDWAGKQVFVGFDLAMTTDNCAVGMVADDEQGGIIATGITFIPEDRISEKSEVEKVDYKAAISRGECIACGDRVVDYGVIENYILTLEERYGVRVLGFGFDRYNGISTAQKLEAEGLPGTIVEQHSRVLHPPIKWLSELIADGNFHYTDNVLLEINFQNCRYTYDTNMNRYINKKKSTGKVDMVMALVNALYLLQQSKGEEMDWAVQV